MRTQLLTGFALLAFASAGFADDKTITFGKGSVGKTPPHWAAAQTGKGECVWKVVEDATAPSKSGFALAQTRADKDALFNLCVLNDDSIYKDVEAIVAFKANAGEKDQGGGIVWRYRDPGNYYVARMNPLEDNFRVYKVVDGRRSREFQDAEVKVKAGEWHTLKIKMVADHIECFVDGRKYLDVKDSSLTAAGRVGLWTKADAQTSFDQFTVKEAK